MPETITDRLSIASSSGGYEPELITEWAEAFSRRTVGIPLTGAAMPASQSPTDSKPANRQNPGSTFQSDIERHPTRVPNSHRQHGRTCQEAQDRCRQQDRDAPLVIADAERDSEASDRPVRHCTPVDETATTTSRS
jgi:hypothetical protein